MESCIFCDSLSIEKLRIPNKDAYKINCPLCISYIISGIVLEVRGISNISKEDRILFSGYLRNNSTEYNPMTILSNDIIKIPEIVAPYKRLSPTDKLNKVIVYFAESSTFFGAIIPFDVNSDYTRFYCKNTAELGQIEKHLLKSGFIEITPDKKGRILTFDGWNKYEALKEINENSKRVFVAMDFDPALKSIFNDAIYPACEECGFKAFRVDSEEHIEKICDKIIADIKSSRFIIADFTGQKHGAYFEAGFAQGLGLKVIWTCKKDQEKELKFDTRQYNHILWEDKNDLKVKLINKIRAVIK